MDYSSMAQPNPHDLVTCPYNRAHQVEHYRMHIHLQKCRKQYPNCNKMNCPFDATHVVNDVELDYHINTCPKRGIFDNQVHLPEAMGPKPVEVIAPPSIPTEENWDNDCVTSYKPDPITKGNVLVKAKGLTPSERRKVRMEGIKTYKPQV